MWDERQGPRAAIVEEKGLKQISDTGAIEGDRRRQVIADNPGQVEQYKGGENAKISSAGSWARS